MKQLFIALLLFIIIGKISSQQICKSVLIDSASKQPVEFANIGILGKGIGTVTNEKGEFSLVLPDSLKNEKIKISMIGYKSKTFAVAGFEKHTKILLSQNAVSLNEVAVSAKKLKVKVKGNDTRTKAVQAGFVKNNLGCELAIKLNIKEPQTHIRKFYLNINHNKIEKPIFRFNVYSVDENGFPKENILTQNIVIEPKEKEGFIEFDLTPYTIFVDQDVFIAVEWIKDLGDARDLSFSAKFGGSATYFRQASQDKWHKMSAVGVGLHAEIAY